MKVIKTLSFWHSMPVVDILPWKLRLERRAPDFLSHLPLIELLTHGVEWNDEKSC